MITYKELIKMYKSGRLRDMVKEIKNNFGFYDFATEIEMDKGLTNKEKVKILVSILWQIG